MSKTKQLTVQSTTKSTQVSAQVVIESIEKKAGKNFSALQKLQVVDAASYDKAASLLKELKLYKKEGETQEATITNPLKQALKATQSLFKPFYTKVDTIEAATKTAMLEFLSAQEAKQKKLNAKFESGEIKKVSTLMGQTAKLQVTSTNASQRVTKEVVVDDVSLIPREFMVPDMVKIKAHYKETGKLVKGCKVEERKGLAI